MPPTRPQENQALTTELEETKRQLCAVEDYFKAQDEQLRREKGCLQVEEDIGLQEHELLRRVRVLYRPRRMYSSLPQVPMQALLYIHK